MKNLTIRTVSFLIVGLMLVLELSGARVLAQASENKLLLTAPFYENVKTVHQGVNQCLGIALPAISDPQKVADAINKYIQEFEQRTGKSSPFHGLGSSFVSGAQSGGVNPFLATAHLFHESGFATAPEGWHTTTPPSFNAFGRSAAPTQPNTTYTRPDGSVRLVYRWNSWQDSLDGPENWFKYIRAVYLENYKIDPNNLPGFIARYAPKSDGNNEEAYVRILQETMQKLVEYSSGGVTCGGTSVSAVGGGGSAANIQLGQKMASDAGWTGNEWTCLLNLWTKESNWAERAINDAEGNNDLNGNRRLEDNETLSETEKDAYGIPQSLPGGKMASKGTDWRTNPATQIAWGLEYIKGRYTTPCKAWDFWQKNKHY